MNASPVRSALRLPLVLSSLLAFAAAATSVSAAEPTADDAKPNIPIISIDEQVQKELVNLDRLLETNPKLEETLRNNLDQLTQRTFREQNPDIDSLLKRQPGLVTALKTERHFFIHRYLARVGRVRVTRADAVALDNFLTAHPDIEKPLAKKPSQIVEANFLIAHPQLATFFDAHPALSSVVYQQSEKKKTGTKTGAQEKKN